MPYFGIPIRNGLPIGLGSVAGFGVQQFSPADLFSAGEQGAWYDPSDLSTLFTDSAGTTPVTGVEQFVGLMLDKSKGFVQGVELISNGTFASGTTGWTAVDLGGGALPTLTVNSGSLRITNGASFGCASTSFATVAGKTYKLLWDFVGSNSTARYIFRVGSTLNGFDYLDGSTVAGSLGTKGFIFTATGTTAYLTFGCNTAIQTYIDIDNVSVKEISGNHATSTGTKRPKLAARYNLLTYTEDLSNGVWATAGSAPSTNPTKSTTTGLLPNGTTGTIDVLTFPAVLAGQFAIVFQNTGQALVNVSTTATVYARVQSGIGTIYVNVEDNGAAPSAGNFYVSSAQTLTTTWQRLSISGTRTVNVGGTAIIIGFDTRAAAGQTNAAPLVVELWGADFRPTSQATGLIGPTYQRVVDAATYDAVGYLPYLQFDGIDDSMSTGSINFTATDKMTVWAGVRKLSDAVDGMLCELSTTFSTSGAFYFTVPESSALISYAFLSRGTAAASSAQRASTVLSAYPAPITNVLAATGNIAGDLSTIRVNGVAGTNATGDQGSGNYGNYPLFIGARANTSVFFNGWLTSLIVRGAQSTQSQIEATESWVNGKTGAF